MHLTPKFKELSFLIYGLGLSGQSVVRFFFKKKKLIIFEFGMIEKKNYLRIVEQKISKNH